MGSGMARNLHRAGLLVGVFNRTAAKAQALAAELKLTAYPTVQALGADVDAVVSCVSADADVLEVAAALAPALKRGGLLLDCSTIGAERAPGGAAAAAGRGGVPRLPCERRHRGCARCHACHHGRRLARGVRARPARA
jgi:3-hydroxyisobutyrate dehydrogenase